MKMKKFLVGIISVAFSLSLTGLISVYADTKSESSSYTIEDTSASRALIVDGELYGSIEHMAKVVQKNIGADMFEIQPLESYGDDFNTVADRALDEQENSVLPKFLNHIENLDQYDTIFVGNPVWWYDMPQVMYGFFDEYDFSGKTIIPSA